ncbi:MAG: ABC-F family ATP-binding cassette domain-containing protein [Cyanobacteria bacterium]|nr:ABC-F family ATP-binding cassette domain-containing protein [Cyanobacteriota bacterium]
MLIEANEISINFGQRLILDEVSLRITPQSRIGLIGANGAGKSTLLQCLMSELTPQIGEVKVASKIQVKHLTQNPTITPGNTLDQELKSVYREVQELQKEEIYLSEQLGVVTGDEFDNALVRLGEIQDKLDRFDASKIDEKIGRMILGLGFTLDELQREVQEFSGGWQMRINLAKVLLQEADVILMDEPTNHLDMEACEWLEEFLRSYPYGILVVSHDRRFLNEVVTEIAELERGKLTIYPGNYDKFVEQKAARREYLISAAKRQEKHIAEQMDFINKFRASARKSTQAKSREKQLTKLERVEAPPSELRKLSFKFPFPNPSARHVLSINNLSKGFGGNQLFEDISLDLEWTKEEPQRVFILGANGCGKTTLFKILMGLETPDTGDATFDSKVKLGYYAQHQLQILDPKKTVIKTLEDAMPPTPEKEIRGILGRFLFSRDDVFKEVELTSGGEKARLAMARLMVSGPNTLLLDEPTNHLDTPSQEAVEAALKSYEGTVICISHDRYFINNHATQIWEFDHGRLIVFKGNYEDYLNKRNKLLAESRAKLTIPVEAPKELKQGAKEKAAKKEAKEFQKALKALERDIQVLHRGKEELTEKLLDPNLSSDYQALNKLTKELEELNTELEAKEAQWVSQSHV